MKLIIREYLSSLRERGELDAILPDLLGELGFNVYSRPQRGTVQFGVDVAAVGTDEDGEKKVFLFSVKAGDLGRQDWDGSPQALRSSLNEIIDAYIPSRIPNQFSSLKIVICICLGGDVKEQVRPLLTGFTDQNSSDKVSFQEWNGDKISELLLKGILREEVLPREYRSSFQKAVAMADEPDIAYHHFSHLASELTKDIASKDVRVRGARQIYICLWILFVWSREIDNLEAPYRLSELSLLRIWDLLRPTIGEKEGNEEITQVLHQLIQLHLTIASDFLERKIFPHVGKRDALSLAVTSHAPVDVNLSMFEVLGRVSMAGLWHHWLISRQENPTTEEQKQFLSDWAKKGINLIRSNPVLLLPIRDDQAIEVTLFLLCLSVSQSGRGEMIGWLSKMSERYDITIRTSGRYPCVFREYRDLAEHPKATSQEYFEGATSGSILLPLIAAWLRALGQNDAIGKLVELKREKLGHCTTQLWLPDADTENSIYVGGEEHGVALTDIAIDGDCSGLLEDISTACKKYNYFNSLSPIATGYWPILLHACKHYRHPIPPHFWIDLLVPKEEIHD